LAALLPSRMLSLERTKLQQQSMCAASLRSMTWRNSAAHPINTQYQNQYWLNLHARACRNLQ
jgi:hypothetical protein